MLWGLEWLLAIVTLVYGVYIYGTRNFDYFKKRNIPYVASSLPFLGTLWPMMFGQKAFPDMFASVYNEGVDKFIGFFDMNRPAVMIRDPEIVKAITVKDFDHFVDRIALIDEDADSFWGKSLLTLGGHRWRDARGTLSPAFTSSKMKAMFVLVSESGEQLANHLERNVQGEKSGTLEVDMKDLYTRYTNDVIATSAFGVSCDSFKEPENEFFVRGKESASFNGTRGVLVFGGFRMFPRIMKFLGFSLIPERSKQFFRSVVSDTMELREREKIIRPDMIHLMMEAKKGNLTPEHSEDVTNEQKPRRKIDMTDEEITAHAYLFFLGGGETSSTTLCFLSTLLATNPDTQSRLQAEIDSTLASSGSKVTYEGLQNMKYLDGCVSEALRLFTPGAVTNRTCIKPYVLPATETLPSFRIEKGMGVWIPLHGFHRDPKYFPDPERFDPERFSEENKHNILPYTYMPFGTGPRNCIGMRFAQMEVKLAIVYILARFDLVVIAKTATELQFDKASFTMAVEGGFWLGVRARNKIQ